MKKLVRRLVAFTICLIMISASPITIIGCTKKPKPEPTPAELPVVLNDGNISLGKKTMVSSEVMDTELEAYNSREKGNDGNPNTVWQAIHSSTDDRLLGTFYQIDLGIPHKITKVGIVAVLDSQAEQHGILANDVQNARKNFKVFASNDAGFSAGSFVELGSQGTTPYTAKTDGGLSWSADVSNTNGYRYVRFEKTIKRQAFSAAEFKVFGTPSGDNIFVSVNGNDSSGNGSLTAPYKTIQKAQEIARGKIATMKSDVVVALMPGTYSQEQTLRFNETDSGKNGFKVRYVAYGDNVVISGGKQISNWSKVSGADYYKSAVEIDHVRQLYVNGNRRQRARSAKEIKAQAFYKEDGANVGIYIKTTDLPELVNNANSQIELHGYVYWKDYYLLVDSVEVLDDGLTLLKMQSPLFAYAVTQSPSYSAWSVNTLFYVENAKELLTAGEWFFDEATDELFYYPQEGESMETANVYVPVLEQIMNISASADDKTVENLEIDGIYFKHSKYTDPSTDGFITSQTEWLVVPVYDDFMPKAAVELNNINNVTFANNCFTNIGYSALNARRYINNFSVVGNAFMDTGAAGLVIGFPHDWVGYTQEFFQSEENVARNLTLSNNLFTKAGAEFRGHAALQVYFAKDVEITNNHIENVPYSGISVGWGWTQYNDLPEIELGDEDNYLLGGYKISNNYITNYINGVLDGGGVYMLGKMFNNVVSENYIVGQKNISGALYPDEGTWNVLFENNVIEDALSWMHIHQKTIQNITAKNNYSTTTAGERTIDEDTCNVDLPYNLYVDGLVADIAQEIIDNAGIKGGYRGVWAYVDRTPNTAPIISLATTATVNIAGTLELVGTVMDDGKPYSSTYVEWSVLSGPKNFTLLGEDWYERVMKEYDSPVENYYDTLVYFADYNSAYTTATFLYPGTYELQLMAYDGALMSTQTITVTVTGSADFGTNIALNKPTKANDFYDYPHVPITGDEGRYKSYPSELLVDGQMRTEWATGIPQSSPTKPLNVPDQIIIDLEAEYDVSRIELFLRQEIDQLVTRNYVEIQLSNSPTFDTYKEVASHGVSYIPFKGVMIVNIEEANSYRFVRVVRTVEAANIWSAFCEIAVYGDYKKASTAEGLEAITNWRNVGGMDSEDSGLEVDNIAFGKKVTASGEYTADNRFARLIVDANPYTYWYDYSEQNAQWIIIDLEDRYFVEEIGIIARLDGYENDTERSNFKVQLSNNPNFAFGNFVTVHTQGDNPYDKHATLKIDVDVAESYRYLRVIRDTAKEMSIAEIVVKGDVDQNPVDNEPVNIALGKELTVSSVGFDNLGSFAIDGNTASFWYPIFWEEPEGSTSYIIVDLGAGYVLNAIGLVARNDGYQNAHERANFEVQVSNNANFSTFVTLGSQGETPYNIGLGYFLDVADQSSYRYVRFIKTVRQDFSIAEIIIYGTLPT